MSFDGIPVVYEDGDAVEIVASVAERTGMAVADLAPTPLEELLDAGAMAFGDAELRPCAREATTMSVVEADLARAEEAFGARDKAAALDLVDAALAGLGCLSEVAAPRAAAKGFLLRALLLAEQGDDEGARHEVRTALALDPEASWPSGGTLDGEVLLAAERDSDAAATLALSPPAGASGPWIDGHQVPPGTASLTLAPGLHLAQHEAAGAVQSAWVLVGEQATLVWPPAFQRPVLERMADPDTRAEVEQLVVAGLEGASTAYVVSGEGLWLVTTDEEGILTIELSKAAEPERAPQPIRIRLRGKDKRRPR